MKIGLFMTPQWRPDADIERGIENIIAQARAARENGFSSLFVGQHMVTGPSMQMLQTVPLMARLIPDDLPENAFRLIEPPMHLVLLGQLQCFGDANPCFLGTGRRLFRTRSRHDGLRRRRLYARRQRSISHRSGNP